MTKKHADALADISPIDPHHPWVARGYRPDFAYAMRSVPLTDLYGEDAYQRALMLAAESKSRRVPDPERYPNSHSAREFLAQKMHTLFSVKPRNGEARASSQPNTPPFTGSHGYPPTQLPSPSYTGSVGGYSRNQPGNANYEPVPSMSRSGLDDRRAPHVSREPVGQHTEASRSYSSYPSHGLPLPMEPKFDSSGPVRKLR
jgi:hypothetical protein